MYHQFLMTDSNLPVRETQREKTSWQLPGMLAGVLAGTSSSRDFTRELEDVRNQNGGRQDVMTMHSFINISSLSKNTCHLPVK